MNDIIRPLTRKKMSSTAKKSPTLRFFTDKTKTSAEIEELLLKDDRIKSVMCANNNGVFDGYGYCKLYDEALLQELLNSTYKIDDVTFHFD
jgi:hypothetical protein